MTTKKKLEANARIKKVVGDVDSGTFTIHTNPMYMYRGRKTRYKHRFEQGEFTISFSKATGIWVRRTGKENKERWAHGDKIYVHPHVGYNGESYSYSNRYHHNGINLGSTCCQARPWMKKAHEKGDYEAAVHWALEILETCPSHKPLHKEHKKVKNPHYKPAKRKKVKAFAN